MSNVLTGGDVPVYYVHEDNGFNASPNDSTNKAFGANATMDRAEGTNNAVEVMEPASKTPIEIIEQAFEGSWTVTFDYVNPWWLAFLFGSPSTTENSDGTHTHTFSDANEALSHKITAGYQGASEGRVLTGCVAATATINPSVGGTAQVQLQGAYAEETPLGEAPASQPSLGGLSPMTFAEASLDRDGSTLGYVQDATVEIPTNIRLIQEFGSRIAVDYAQHQMTPTIQFSKITPADSPTSELEEMYGGSTGAGGDVSGKPMELALSNGASAGSGLNKVAFALEGVTANTVGQEQLGNPTETIQDQVNSMTTGITADATNEEATAK